jgi:hypothetical protein
MYLARGRVLVRRHFQRAGQLCRVWAGHVAADDERGLWLWIASGSVSVELRAADGRTIRDMPFAEWGYVHKVLCEVPWRGDVLMLHPPNAEYSVWFFFEPDGTFRNWYVNLERPTVRWEDGAWDDGAWDDGVWDDGAWDGGGLAGVDTSDHDLDIVVEPDRTWRWKDEEEFAEHLRHPDVYWVSDPDAVRAAGERVVKLVEVGEFPFDGTGTDFRPPADWPVPAAMPAGWDRPRL